MKTQMKSIGAVAIVTVLALAAVSGVTYSWFSDSETSEINITTGKLSLSVPLDKVTINSQGYSEKNVADGVVTEGGATARYNSTTTPTTVNMILDWKNVSPNEYLHIYTSEGTVDTSIKVVYRETVKITEGDVDITESAPFTIQGLSSDITLDPSETAYPISAHTISISMNNVGNDYQNKTYKISISFEVTQYNATLNAPAVVNGVEYNTVKEAFDAAVDGDTIWVSSGVQPMNNTRFIQKNVTFEGNPDGSSVLQWTANPGAGSNPSDRVVLNNITLNITNENYAEYFDTNYLEMNNCTINGRFTVYSLHAVFNKCTFNTEGDVECIWSSNYADKTADGQMSKTEFIDCTFNSKKYAINVYTEKTDSSDTRTLIIKGCTFNNTGHSDRAAINIKVGFVNWNIIISDVKSDSFAVEDHWLIKKENANVVEVYINGINKYPL